MRASGAPSTVLAVVLDVAPVQHGVLGRADVDERGLHAGQHVLDPGRVDVAVDLADVVLRPGHVVLDERPAFEHGDLRGLGPHVDEHEVAPDRPALALAAPTALQDLVVERRRGACRHRSDRRLRPRPPRRRRLRGWPCSPRSLSRSVDLDPEPRADAGAGRVSPIWGLRGTTAAAAARVEGRPSRSGSGSSSGSRLSPPAVVGRATAAPATTAGPAAAGEQRQTGRTPDADDRCGLGCGLAGSGAEAGVAAEPAASPGLAMDIVVFPSHDARSRAWGASGAARRERFLPGAVALNPLVRAADAAGQRVDAEGDEQFGRANAAGLGGQLAYEPAGRHRPGRGSRAGCHLRSTGPCARGVTTRVGAARAESILEREIGDRLADVDLPCARRDVLLERRAALGGDRHDHVEAVGQRPRRVARRRRREGSRAPGRCRDIRPPTRAPVGSASPKLIVGRGEKPSLYATGKPGAPECALPHAGDVAVAGPADLSELREAAPESHAGAF